MTTLVERFCRRWPICSTLLAVLLCATVAPVSPAAAAEPSDWPKAFACTFDGGTTSSYADGKFASRAPAPLNFDIATIDLDRQSAALLAHVGAAPAALRIVRAINANHFIEVVNEGFLNLTTIYDADPSTGRHPAVHSRHFGLLGQPVFAQYTGLCTPK
ncbi:MAG: hypothetical protein NW205_09495 [Hyphomicrobiaceae bacterium]|nr:hypothetical protein [Hyphomicrobiaceae bacterium]